MASIASATLVVFFAGSARAQDPAADERARIHFEAGRMHMERGACREAATEFDAAYRESPRPELLHNLYRAHELCGDLDNAERNLVAYLEQGTLTPAERSALDARLTNLRSRRSASSATTSATTATPTGAGPAPSVPGPPPVAPSHDGFLIRFTLGPGFASATGDAYVLSGGAGIVTLAFGYAFFDRLAIHVELWAASMIGASIRGRGFASSFVFRDEDTKYTAAMFGIGATYWLLPINIYLVGTVGTSEVSASRGGLVAESDPGFGLRLAAGKEWWVADGWVDVGLGVAIEGVFLATPENLRDGAAFRENLVSTFVGSVLGTITFD